MLASGAAAATVRVGVRANGSTLHIRAGDVVVVTLSENATTGYGWRVAQIDRRRLKVVSSRYVAPKTTKPPKVGAAGKRVVRLRARARGTSLVGLAYERSFERNKPPAKWFSLRVVVRA